MPESSRLSPPPTRFFCSSCDRSYTTRGALLRHQNSHDRDSWHSCSSCGLRFHRKDLLNRHQQIHKPNRNAPGQARSRQRIARACNECRKAKVRCDGASPCGPCVKYGKTCTYSSKPGRLSLQAGQFEEDEEDSAKDTHTSAESVIQGQQKPYISPPSSLMATGEKDGSEPFTSSATSQAAIAATMMTTAQPQADSTIVEGIDFRAISDMDLSGINDSWVPNNGWSENVAWPWLHEDMFMQNSLPLANPSPMLSGFQAPPTMYAGAGVVGSGPFRPAAGLPAFVPAPVPSQRAPGSDMAVSAAGTSGQTDDITPSQGDPHAERTVLAVSPEEATEQARIKVVKDLVEAAGLDLSYNIQGDPVFRTKKRQAASRSMAIAFGLINQFPDTSGSNHFLHRLVGLYFEHFHHLWPLSWKQGVDLDSIEPLLYLTFSSIGAMYAGGDATQYGLVMHKFLRTTLISACLQCSDIEEKTESIFEALLLTQVMALYFGQSQAFSFAQQVSAVLTCHARRIRLFERGTLPEHSPAERLSPDDQIARWIHAEKRRRLGFGFFRSEISLSILLNTKPLVSFEEVNLELPCANDIWCHIGPGWRQKIVSAMEQQACGSHMLYSDLVRIAFERDEVLPPISAFGYELVLYGLHTSVWRFSHDREIFNRITGHYYSQNIASDPYGGGASHGPPNRSMPQMNDLKSEYNQMLLALEKWRVSHLQSAQFSIPSGYNLSSLVLYQISFVRLNADLETLHLLSYQRDLSTALSRRRIRHTHDWAQSSSASIALQYACKIWSLIAEELRRKENERVDFNILSIISLHDAAVVVWALAGTHENPIGSLSLPQPSRGPGMDLRIMRSNTRVLLMSFANLIRGISPTWKTLSSFAQTAEKLANRPFPVLR